MTVQTSSSDNGEGDVEGLVERLKPYVLPRFGGDPPVHAEIMKTWDDIRTMLLVDGNKGSGPRDVFEALLCGIYEDITEAASAISKLIGERDASELARELLAQELREERWHHDQTAGGLNDAIAVLHQKLQAAEQGGCRVVFSPAAKRRAWQLVEDAAKRLDGYEVEDVEILRALEAAEDEPDWKARAQAAEQEIGELREGLKPFAIEADEWSSKAGDGETVLIMSSSDDEPDVARFTVGDLRKARALLSRGGSGEGNQGVSSSQGSGDARSSTRPDGPHSAGGEP